MSKVEVSKAQLKKAEDVLATGLRLIRGLDASGATAEQQRYAEAREQVRAVLQGPVDVAERVLEEARALKAEHGERLAELAGWRGRISLPVDWAQIGEASQLVNNGSDGWQRVVSEARSVLADVRPDGHTVKRAAGLAAQLAPLTHFADGLRYHLGNVERMLARVIDSRGPDALRELIPPAPPAPAEPTEAEKRANAEAKALNQIYSAPKGAK